jgi:hypothetical protein
VRTMSNIFEIKRTSILSGLTVALLLVAGTACSKQQTPTVKKISAGAEFSGFLKDYAKLTPVKGMEGKALGYAATDAQKNLHKYIAAVVDPVEVYLASDADGSKMTELARSAATEYFRAALVKSVSDAYPVVDQAGPLVLRLRAAVVGVDFGPQAAAAEGDADKGKALTYPVKIGKVRVEMELVDSETGEQIAALVDQQYLGEGAEIGNTDVARQARWAAAREAFDGWASRVRNFLNLSTELSPEESDRADKSYEPYGPAPAATK